MSKKACNKRMRNDITQQSFQESWLKEFQSRIDTSLFDHIIPFIFIDTEVCKEEGPTIDEEEKAIFAHAKMKICELAAGNSLFPCLRLDADIDICKKFHKEALEKVCAYPYPSQKRKEYSNLIFTIRDCRNARSVKDIFTQFLLSTTLRRVL
jgi:hypothetical protein